jgi:hypothetical protein
VPLCYELTAANVAVGLHHLRGQVET